MENRKGLLLGAGFSYDFGMPLVWELTTEIKKWLTPEKFVSFNEKWIKNGIGFSKKSEQIFLGLLSSDNLHYEHIIGNLEVQQDRHENRKIRQELSALKNWFIEIVFTILYTRQIRNNSFINTSVNIYRGLKSLTELGYPLWVFTLNHDLMFECVANKQKIPLKNGFSENIVNFKSNSSDKFLLFQSLSKEDMEKGLFNFFKIDEPGGVNLLKIHGSLDVFGYNDLKDYLCLKPSNSTIQNISETLSELIENPYPKSFTKVTNEIVLKDKHGLEQFLRISVLSGAFKFSEKNSQVIPPHFLRAFKANINYCTELISIGYGFGDSHINDILRNWLEFNSDRKLVVVNPTPPDLGSLGHLSSQISFETSSALEYISSLPNGKLNTSEYLLWKARTKVRQNKYYAKAMKVGIYAGVSLLSLCRKNRLVSKYVNKYIKKV